MTSEPVVLLDSITDIGAAHAGCVAVSGSHGGLYPASVASRGGLRAAVFNDAGIGLQDAGVAGVLALGRLGMAAFAAEGMSCEIGSAGDTWRNGRVSIANMPAQSLGVSSGMAVSQAVACCLQAGLPPRMMAEIAEARQTRRLASGLEVTLVDSASLVGPMDAGRVVVTGSHGGLIGGEIRRALKAPAHIAAFNDAGMGRNGIGVTRLPALEAQGIAAVTVSHRSARIGDAVSSLEDGTISAANAIAAALGARLGRSLGDWLGTVSPE